ncbi:MAG: hypothetical protein ABSH01_23870 [Terriglobia bacterium]|jgi:hypothetical protein
MGGQPHFDFDYDPTGVVVFKWFMPVLALLATTLLLEPGRTVASVAIALLLVLWAVFGFSAAQVRAGKEGVRFRRFRTWKEVPYSEVRKCRMSWAPGMCCLKLRQSVAPWGKIYFICEGPRFELALPGRHTKLTRYIEERASRRDSSARLPASPGIGGSLPRRVSVCALWFSAGAMWAFYSLSVPQGRAPLRVPLGPHGDGWLVRLLMWWREFNNAVVQWPWNLLAALLTLGLILLLRFRRSAWGPALALGLLVGSVAARLVAH